MGGLAMERLAIVPPLCLAAALLAALCGPAAGTIARPQMFDKVMVPEPLQEQAHAAAKKAAGVPPALQTGKKPAGADPIPSADPHTIGKLTPEQAANISTRVPVFAGGNRELMCDACKTMVEELHRRLSFMVEHMNATEKQATRHATDPARGIWNAAAEQAVDTLCTGGRYQHFAP